MKKDKKKGNKKVDWYEILSHIRMPWSMQKTKEEENMKKQNKKKINYILDLISIARYNRAK